jgi:hypothetical protein
LAHRKLLLVFGCLAFLAACASQPPPAVEGPALDPGQARALIEELLPRGVADRSGWATDIYAGFSTQGLVLNRKTVCAVIAVTAQESDFHTDPVVPGLGAIARKEIDSRAQRADIPLLIVHAALNLRSPDGRTYSERVDAARTERDLSNIYEDFIGSIPLARTLFADRNPIRTRGPMQVNVEFANQYAAVRSYPYRVKGSLAEEVFTRRGSLYFGIAHLFAYEPHYEAYIFRFADFNAGQYASRNAAFQAAAGRASGLPLTPDGALLSDEGGTNSPGETELALRSLSGRLTLNQKEIHHALEQGKSQAFAQTDLYQRVFALAQRTARRPLPRALIPTISLHGPKISRALTTSWYAHRVNGRFEQCERR